MTDASRAASSVRPTPLAGLGAAGASAWPVALLLLVAGCAGDDDVVPPPEVIDPFADASVADADADAAGGVADADDDTAADGEGEGEGDVDAGEGEGEGEGEPDRGDAGYVACFSAIGSQTGVVPDIAQFAPRVGSHCGGTNHQDITGIERVVFLGDSVTVGTPPTVAAETYRARLAQQLAAHFGLEAPSGLWERYDAFEGTALVAQSGDFWSCARWGARNHDLLTDERQIDACFPADQRHKKTLVLMTVGGNDIAHFTKMGIEGAPLDEISAYVDGAAAELESAIRTLKDPTLFPAGNAVVFANPPEFTDGTGDVGSCPTASLGGYDRNWEDPVAQARLVVRLLETYVRVAVQTQSDLVFFLENFCGHGFRNDDPAAACYRGPDTERWFDLTCTHPNPAGHGELARLFFDVVRE
jgi:lysophospholipase L1-like esterase